MIGEKEKKVRINWEYAIDPDTRIVDRRLVNDETIKADFNDRLVSGEVESLDEYKDWVCGIDSQFRVHLLREGLVRALLHNQNDFKNSNEN